MPEVDCKEKSTTSHGILFYRVSLVVCLQCLGCPPYQYVPRQFVAKCGSLRITWFHLFPRYLCLDEFPARTKCDVFQVEIQPCKLFGKRIVGVKKERGCIDSKQVVPFPHHLLCLALFSVKPPLMGVPECYIPTGSNTAWLA